MFDGFIVVQKIKTRKNGNIIINVGPELFYSFGETKDYVMTQFQVKKFIKPYIFENDDFIIEIKPLHAVECYIPSTGKLILKGEE